MKKRVLYICFIEYINNIGPLPGFPPLFYIFTIKKYKKNYKKYYLTYVIPHMKPCHGQSMEIGLNGHRRTSNSQGIRRRRDPRAWQNIEVKGHPSASGSKGMGIEGLGWTSKLKSIQGHGHRRARASKGHRSLIGIGFSELLKSFWRISRIYTPASSPGGHWYPWRLGKLTVSDTVSIVSTI